MSNIRLIQSQKPLTAGSSIHRVNSSSGNCYVTVVNVSFTIARFDCITFGCCYQMSQISCIGHVEVCLEDQGLLIITWRHIFNYQKYIGSSSKVSWAYNPHYSGNVPSRQNLRNPICHRDTLDISTIREERSFETIWIQTSWTKKTIPIFDTPPST